MPKLSIVTVCFNSEKTLERTLESVARQLVPGQAVDYIVVDGSSTDGTRAIIERWSRLGLISRWISEPDKGIYDAMNKGVALASGQYVCCLNSDDTLEPGALAICLQAADTSVAYFYGNNITVTADGRVFSDKLPRCRIINETLCCHQALWVRRDVIAALDGYRTTVGIAADEDFMIRLFAKYGEGLYLDRPLCTFHMGGQSGTRAYAESDRNIRLHHMEHLSEFGRINKEYAETFLHGWSGRLLDWTRNFTSSQGHSAYLEAIGRGIGIPSRSSPSGKLLLRLTLRLFRWRARFFSRLPLRCSAMLLHLNSVHQLRKIDKVRISSDNECCRDGAGIFSRDP